ncbi:MAG TPA: sulfite exporter TauE/SafE family protein [Thermoleophilaceae bacterium]|nr:sulfite exporter TauE/SafE family protein [Thermoleophilaceae bacterium]
MTPVEVARGRSGAMQVLAVGLTLVAAVLAAPTTAHAHPLGNFSVNHVTTVRISDDRVNLRYLLDQAEIPTLQERALSPNELLERKRAEVLRGLELSVDGKRTALRFEGGEAGGGAFAQGGARVTFPPGSGGLPTSRFEFRLSAPVDSPRSVRLRDDTFEDRVGWRAIVAAPGEGTAVRTDVPSGDSTNGLRRYPDDLLSSPLDRRDAGFTVRPGDGTLVAPRSEGGELATTTGGDREDGFAGLFERASAGEGVLVLLLLAAFGWGALHALSPGHGKAMVAAYLVGTRGQARHAVALGATVTVTHTIGVFALGLVTLALSQYVLPEDLYPWLNLAAGLLVVAIGAGVLRSRIKHSRQHHHHHHHHHPHHEVTRRSLLGMGAAAGLIPCPSALVVLLAAVSQHEVALGMLLIVAFSLGLAGTLTALGLAVVYARRLVPGLKLPRLAAALPAASALVIVGVGCLLTLNAIPEVQL